jgi:ribosomal protein L24
MLSPRELVLYNKAKNLRTNMQLAEFERALHWEMLADADVEPHSWVRAPDQFDCRVGFVLTVTDLVVIQLGKVSVQVRTCSMSQRWFPKVEPSFAEIALFAESTLSALSRVVLAKPSPALDAGDRVVVTTGDRKDSTGIIKGVADIRIAGKRVAMAQVLPPAPKPYPKGKGPIAPVKLPKPFEVGLAQLKRHALDLYYHFRIHDRVRVVSGALYVGAIGRVEEVEGDFLTVAIPKDWEVVGATWPSPTSDITKLFIISIVHVTRQWAIGDSVRVTRGQYEGQVGVILELHNSGYLELLNVRVSRALGYFSFPPDQLLGKCRIF